MGWDVDPSPSLTSPSLPERIKLFHMSVVYRDNLY